MDAIQFFYRKGDREIDTSDSIHTTLRLRIYVNYLTGVQAL